MSRFEEEKKMTNKEAVNWIINLSADIGKSEHSELWHYEQALYEIREILESAQQWIPVSERPPEVTGRYIVTNTMTGAWEIDIDMWLGEWRDNEGVVAWMDMPEPYKEAENDDNL